MLYFLILELGKTWASLVAQRLKRLPAMQETWVGSLGQEDPLEKEMATHCSILAWRIPWVEEPDGLQSMGSQRDGHDWATSLSLSMCLPTSTVYCGVYWWNIVSLGTTKGKKKLHLLVEGTLCVIFVALKTCTESLETVEISMNFKILQYLGKNAF